MNIGDIVEADVIETHEGYALLAIAKFTATLMQTEVTWKAGKVDISKHLKCQKSIKVRITDIKEKRFSVSLKQVEPNPWSNPPTINQHYSAKVVLVAEYGYFVRIEWYCDALLHINDARSSHIVGDTINLKVSVVDVKRHRVQVVEI